jgi:two-component system sensor histidine kinase BaeS
VRRRLTIAMLAVVAGALVVAGLGSLLVVRFIDLRNASRSIQLQAQDLARIIDNQTGNATASRPLACHDLGVIATVAHLVIGQVGLLEVSPSGSVTPILPADLATPRCVDAATATILTAGASSATSALSQRDLKALAAGDGVYGVHNSRVYAAAPLALSPFTLTALAVPSGSVVTLGLTNTVNLPGGSGLYFLFGGGVSLLVAAIVAIVLARRLAEPLALAARTTERIAGGDLEARVPVRQSDPTELVQLGEAINTMAENLSRSRGLERQFLLSISHDLRTPLTSIRGYAEAIADGATTDPAHAAGVIASEAGRLERLFQDLLDLARLDTNRFAIDLRQVDVIEIATAAAEGLRRSLAEGGIGLAVDSASPRPIPVAADPDRLAQVIANLVENASKFARTGVRVAFAPALADPDAVVIVIEDDGPGISAADLPHVFERFYMSERRPAASAKGIGLGLAIVGELTHAMGGEVAAYSPLDADGGTRMTIRLRRWASASAVPPPIPAPAVPAPARPSPGRAG